MVKLSFHRWFVAIAGLCLTSLLAFGQDAAPLPSPTGFVNDYAGVIDAPTKEQLEKRLKEFRDKTNPSVEIGVAVVRTTGERDIFDYSLAVARGWGIGAKTDDNPSALLFVAVDDRKYFTQVSRDLEDELPDGLVGSLQRQYLVPEFRKGNYGKGIADTIEAYIRTIENKGNVASGNTNANRPVSTRPAGSSVPVGGLICCAIVVIAIIILIIAGSSGRGGPKKGDRDRWGGRRDDDGDSILPAIIGGIIGSSLSGGSSSSGGWSGGGGFGGDGGFGGFGGGGDFGGGGAGGGW